MITWSSSYDNPAGIPYIIYEYATGVPLAARWAEIEGRSAATALVNMLMFEMHLLEQPFSQCGSLYFSENVSEELRNRTLYPDAQDLPPEAQGTAPKYRIGPTADREWYRGPYASVKADRGPCSYSAVAIEALLLNETCFRA